jgi:hypothetical protein
VRKCNSRRRVETTGERYQRVHERKDVGGSTGGNGVKHGGIQDLARSFLFGDAGLEPGGVALFLLIVYKIGAGSEASTQAQHRDLSSSV